MRKNSIKNRIYNYASNKSYFSIRDLQKYFKKINVKYSDENLKKSLYRMRKDEIIYSAGRGWYSTLEQKFELDKKPIMKITELISRDFPLLEFSCWGTEQLKAFFHHLPTQFVTFISTEKDYLESLRESLENHNYNVFINPLKSEAEKFVYIKDQTAILRPSITKGEPKDGHFAKIEKIVVDLYMEIKKVNLMDREEFRRVTSNIFNNFRINVADMLEYAERRGIKDTIASFVH
jgi:hypothetical protein